jgi:Tfp pilus assembly protein PilX
MEMRLPLQTSTKKRGAIMAVALVLLTVVMMLGASLTKRMLIYHHQTRFLQLRQQAFWLAESGLERGIQKSAKGDAYEGESWKVPAEALGQQTPEAVVIRIERQSDVKSERKVVVTSAYPQGVTRQFVDRREFNFTSPPRDMK